MKRMLKRATLTLGLFALVVAFTAPPVEAGRRLRARAHYHAPAYRARVVYYQHGGLYHVRVYGPPIVAVPITPVPYYSPYRGPTDFHYHAW